MSHIHPLNAKGFTPEYVTGMLAERYPGTKVEQVDIVVSKTYGEAMVSTAGRAIIDVRYAPGASPELPTRLVVKIPRGDEVFIAPLYENEVAFYRRIRPELKIEAPRCYARRFQYPDRPFWYCVRRLDAAWHTFPQCYAKYYAGECPRSARYGCGFACNLLGDATFRGRSGLARHASQRKAG